MKCKIFNVCLSSLICMLLLIALAGSWKRGTCWSPQRTSQQFRCSKSTPCGCQTSLSCSFLWDHFQCLEFPLPTRNTKKHYTWMRHWQKRIRSSWCTKEGWDERGYNFPGKMWYALKWAAVGNLTNWAHHHALICIGIGGPSPRQEAFFDVLCIWSLWYICFHVIRWLL